MEICTVKNTIGYRIRKLREQRDYTQENMAYELGLSTSAYSKIETGRTDPSVGRITQIAKILGEDPGYFFQEKQISNKLEETQRPVGYASKNDLEELTAIITKMQKEIAELKASVQKPAPKTRKKSS